MKAKAKIPVLWSEDELQFIRENYYQMTWNELVTAIRKMNENGTAPAIRHQCRRMGLAKQVQIRWNKDDIQFLLDNYKTMGNVEMSEILTQRGLSYRMINGTKVTRRFVPKNIEKKMVLLGLERTPEDLNYIIKHNRNTGRGYRWTKESNIYTQGFRNLFPEGTIRVWGTKYKQKYIKVEGGKYTQYSRYQYEKYHGPIPEGHNVWFKDADTLNCSPENLYLVANQEQTVELKARKYPEEYRELIRLNSRLSRQILNITNNKE